MISQTLIGAGLALALALPLAGKWRLGVARSAATVVVLAIASSLTVALVDNFLFSLSVSTRSAGVAALALALGCGLLAQRFYRDPERTPPDEDNVVVSPADGEVVYVRHARDGVLPVVTKRGREYQLVELTKTPLSYADAVVIGIGLSFLDVHVNRSPIGGKVVLQRRYPGPFGSLRRPEMVFENQRATMVIERDDLQVGVVMIASRLVRRIVTYVKEGDIVGGGQRIGMIRFGSQVDLVLPVKDDLQVPVRPGDRVKAGETIVAVFARVPAHA